MFLILTTTFREATEMKIVLPESRTGQPLPTDTPTRVRIEVDADGRVVLAGQQLPLAQLAASLRALPVTPDTQLLLTADERTPHGRVVEVMDAAREAGALQLSIETYRLDAPMRPGPAAE
jgi:biopolymer transport protein ExbD